MDGKTVFVIIHVFGVAVGAGGAYLSDFMFLKSVKDGIISKTEFGFLRLGSTMVWIGIVLLAVSGAVLFSLDIERYLSSSKFLAKMTVVAVIIINGIIFHTTHIPRIVRHMDHHFPSSDEFMRKRTFLLASGALSMTSWSLAIVLGVVKSIPYSYGIIMLAYAAILTGAIGSALLLKNYILPTHRSRL